MTSTWGHVYGRSLGSLHMQPWEVDVVYHPLVGAFLDPGFNIMPSRRLSFKYSSMFILATMAFPITNLFFSILRKFSNLFPILSSISRFQYSRRCGSFIYITSLKICSYTRSKLGFQSLIYKQAT